MSYSSVFCNDCTSDHFEILANNILSHFDYKYPDEIDVEQICWKFGINIITLENGFEDTIAFSVPRNINRRGTIFVKPNLEYIERKIILAEEFCHIYIDTTNQLSCDMNQLRKSEQQAKRMAAYLLMPYHFLKDVIYPEYDQSVLVSEIAEYFLVTEEFAHYRLELLFNHRVDLIANINGKFGTIELFE